METHTTYTAVSFDPNSWSEATGINEIVAECGHQHKTVEAAVKCIGRTWCGNGVPSTLSLHTQVRDSNNKPVDCY
jgi:dissimilatory sulfite reductase (desulfoviridin) alpha/beta subunit